MNSLYGTVGTRGSGDARADACTVLRITVLRLSVLYPFGKMTSKLLTVSSVRDIDQAKELLDTLRGSEVEFQTLCSG